MVVLYHYNFKSQSDGIRYDMLTFYTSQIKGVSTCTVEHINPAKNVNKYKLSHSYHTVYLGMAMGSPALQPYVFTFSFNSTCLLMTSRWRIREKVTARIE